MTSVFITRTGMKYHSTDTCSSFSDIESQTGRSIHAWQTDLHGLSQEPCTICWPEAGGWDQWAQLAHRVERTGDSPFEVQFVERVLRHIPGLQASDVTTQRKAHGQSGDVYYIDFVIEPFGRRQVAVEIDGYQKSPDKSVETFRQETESKRADLVAAGWRVVNFSDAQVATRSSECVGQLRGELAEALAPRPHGPASSASSSQQVSAQVDSTHRSSRRRYLGIIVAAVVLIGSGLVIWKQTSDGSRGVSPDGAGDCPTAAPVKGNVSQDGERIFHEPGWKYYESTKAEECFETGGDAEAAGYRASEVH